MNVKTALVTGSAGFVGRHVAQHLDELGYDVDTCDPEGADGEDALVLFATEGKRYDLVVHAAASAPHRRAIDHEPEHFSYNVNLDAAMFTWAHRTRPGRVVYLSSSAVYPEVLQRVQASRDHRRLREDDVSLTSAAEPDAVYGWTKLTGERLARAYQQAGGRVTVVRPFSGYGEDQSTDFPFAAIVDRAARHEDPVVVLGSGDQVRDWIHVDDVVRAIMVLVKDEVNEPVNLCTGIGTSVFRLATMAIMESGYRGLVSVEYPGDPELPAGRTAGPGGGVLYRVGDPSTLLRYYCPRVSLAEGVHRRVKETH